MRKVFLAPGCWCVQIPEEGLSILCGCPENAVKFLYRAGCIEPRESNEVRFESGPNGILLSEVPIQNGAFSNLGEFPVLHMLYLQGMVVPGHPGNQGRRPLVIGLADQVEAQCRYIFAGNYGLSTVAEMEAGGLDPAEARRQMRMKLAFAFGKIRPSQELLDLRVFDHDAVLLAPGVFLHRKAQNVYEFLSHGQCEEVDLNLKAGEVYGAPYVLPPRPLVPARFSVVHLGDGDGWDLSRPCTGSLVVHGPDLGLVDAGPNLTEGLAALGLSVGSISRLFQTHCHDDHFVGLTALMRSERRVTFHAVPWVRASVEKKFEALTGLGPREYGQYFDVQDLVADQWNDLGGLQVLPLFSPHPVETTVFHFRVAGEGGWKTYGHLADIASFQVLDTMVNDDPGRPGLSADDVARVKEVYRRPVDVKKVDIGGGMIHGAARDFAGDGSGEVLLSHTGRDLTPEELSVGRRPGFGEASVLWPAGPGDLGLWASPVEVPPEPVHGAAVRALLGPDPVTPGLVARLAGSASELSFGPGQPVGGPVPGLWCVVEGSVRLTYGTSYVDRLGPGAFFGEEAVLFGQDLPLRAVADGPCRLVFLPAPALADCPLVLWKLRESFDRRLKAVQTVFRFDWRPEYAVDIPVLDDQHRHLFELIAAIGDAVEGGCSDDELAQRLRVLILYTNFHFKTEQDRMEAAGSPLLVGHREEHRTLADAIRRLDSDLRVRGRPLRHELMEFLKVWLLRHTLLEDRKYSGHLQQRGPGPEETP